MGYRIEYDGGSVKRTVVHFSERKKKLIAGALVAVLTLGVIAWPKSRNAMKDLLIPGDEQVTTAAWEDMVEDLREGEPFTDAVTAFCQEIIYGD